MNVGHFIPIVFKEKNNTTVIIIQKQFFFKGGEMCDVGFGPADGAKDGFVFMEYNVFFSINLVSIWKIKYVKAFTTV